MLEEAIKSFRFFLSWGGGRVKVEGAVGFTWVFGWEFTVIDGTGGCGGGVSNLLLFLDDDCLLLGPVTLVTLSREGNHLL